MDFFKRHPDPLSKLVLSTGLCALAGYVLLVVGSVSTLSPVVWNVVTLFLLSAVGVGVSVGISYAMRIKNLHWIEKGMCLLIGAVLFSSLPLIFVPETGFDALWYHLPISQVLVSSHHSTFLPELYQSAMPRLVSMIFAIPLGSMGIAGIKSLTFFFTLLLLIATYRLASESLSRPWALLVTLSVASFHTVTWQATSAYADQYVALCEVLALILITTSKQLRGKFIWIGVLLGIALSAKLVALFFFPAYVVYLWMCHGRRATRISCIVALVLFLPWQIQGHEWTGRWLYPLGTQINAGAVLAQEFNGGWGAWLVLQAIKLPLLPILLTFHEESYTTPLFLFAVPFLFWWVRHQWRSQLPIITFLLLSLGTWLLIPPVSVRYGLASIIMLLIVCIRAIHDQPCSRRMVVVCVFALTLATTLLHLGLRTAVVVRSRAYLLGNETEQTYVRRFDDPVIHGPLEKWYGGYWKQDF